MHVYRRLSLVTIAVLLALSNSSQSFAADYASAAPTTNNQCAADTIVLAPSASKILPYGSTSYSYQVPGGTFQQVIPPTSFAIESAGPGLLAELGLPARPKLSAELAAWQDEVSPFAHNGIQPGGTFCLVPSVTELTTRSHTRVAPMASVGHTGNGSWSGYENRSGPYQKAVGHFNQPLVGSDPNQAMSNWIGINGSGTNGRLIQAGTINRNSTSAVGTLFWELYCSGTPSVTGCNSVQTPGNYTASAGDDVSVSVSYNPATLMSYYHVAINGALDINVQYQMHSGTNSGNVADLITEHVSGYTLPNFGQLQFSSSRTYTTWNGAAYVLIGNQNYFAWELTSDNQFYTPSCSQSRILAYPFGITGGDFKNQFCRNS